MKKTLLSVFLTCTLGLLTLSSCGKNKKAIIQDKNARELSEQADDVQVFVENSGSMDGYLGQNTQFRSDLLSLLSALDLMPQGKIDTLTLNYVNREIIPIQQNLAQFSHNLSPEAFRQAGGQRGDTNIAQLLKGILTKLEKPNDVAILASDMILSLPSGQSATSVSSEITHIIRKVLAKKSDLSVVVWRMVSDFSGYYYHDAGVPKRLIKGELRPYYYIMFGSRSGLRAVLNHIPNNAPLLERRTHQFILEPRIGAEPSYNVAPTAQQGKYKLEGGGRQLVDTKLGAAKGRDGRGLSFELLVDKGWDTLQDETYLLDAQSYELEPSSYSLERVRNGERYALRVGTKRLEKGELKISLKQSFPQWISQVSSRENTDITKAMDKTYGIADILGGISRAYEADHPMLITFALSIN